MRKWTFALIFGWFFAVQTPVGSSAPEATVSSLIGPFSSEQACKAEADAMKDFLESFGIQFKFKSCFYSQEL